MPRRSSSIGVSKERPVLIKHACAACKARKIRCDKESPCSACKTSNILCEASVRTAQTPRKRIHVTAEYESKLDQIQARLTDLDNVFKTKGTPGTHGTTAAASPVSLVSPANPQTNVIIQRPINPIETDVIEEASTFEGGTSMTALSQYAHAVLQKAIKDVPLAVDNPAMMSAIETLKGLMAGLAVPKNSNTKSERADVMAKSELGRIRLPPTEIVLEVLRQSKIAPTFTFSSPMTSLHLDEMTELCKAVFFCVDSYPLSTAVLVHGHLMYLFTEFSQSTHDQDQRTKYQECSDLCRTSLEISLGNLTIFLQDTFHNIAALLFGSFHAVETCRPSLAYKMIAVATTLCQSLGWHRAAAYAQDTIQQRRRKLLMFWNIYVMDKSLALRVGRASHLQDYDIDVEVSDLGSSAEEVYSSKVLALWVRTARIQGNVYEKLYSPAAMKHGPKLDDLLEQMNRQREQLLELEAIETGPPWVAQGTLSMRKLYRVLRLSDSVTSCMISTMIYRALNSQIECLDAARQALDLHAKAGEYRDLGEVYWSIYLHWTILHVPCAPIIVVFCNILTTSNLEDLKRLHDFTQTLSNGTTEGVRKLHTLCQTFYHVASLYVEARQSSLSTDSAEIWNPPATDLDLTEVTQFNVNAMMDNTLSYWYSGNQFLMGLLEDDAYAQSLFPR